VGGTTTGLMAQPWWTALYGGVAVADEVWTGGEQSIVSPILTVACGTSLLLLIATSVRMSPTLGAPILMGSQAGLATWTLLNQGGTRALASSWATAAVALGTAVLARIVLSSGGTVTRAHHSWCLRTHDRLIIM
jgi:hypothetical protein